MQSIVQIDGAIERQGILSRSSRSLVPPISLPFDSYQHGTIRRLELALIRLEKGPNIIDHGSKRAKIRGEVTLRGADGGGESDRSIEHRRVCEEGRRGERHTRSGGESVWIEEGQGRAERGERAGERERAQRSGDEPFALSL